MPLSLIRAILASEDVSRANLSRLLRGLERLAGHDAGWQRTESRTRWIRRFVEDRVA